MVISSLHGHVTSLLRHSVGSAVIDYVFHLANGSQKQILLMEMYSTKLQLFKDLTLTNSGSRFASLSLSIGISLGNEADNLLSVALITAGEDLTTIVFHYLRRVFELQHAELVAHFSLLRTYPSHAEEKVLMLHWHRVSAALGWPRTFHRPHTSPCMSTGIFRVSNSPHLCELCTTLSVAEQLIPLCMVSSFAKRLACLEHHQVKLSTLSHSSNSAIPTFVRFKFFQASLSFLKLTVCVYFFHLKSSAADVIQQLLPLLVRESASAEESQLLLQLDTGGKKDSFRRRCELMVESGLAEGLFDTCTDNVGELLRSNFGKEVVYEVFFFCHFLLCYCINFISFGLRYFVYVVNPLAVGGSDGILQSFADRMDVLHKAIASLAALPKTNESQEELVLENFHSSRLIRKLVLDCPGFAATLWEMALDGKCDVWAQGHSCKVILAFLESSVS
ncbi:unnamed protein product [Musa hybrid cultivar]